METLVAAYFVIGLIITVALILVDDDIVIVSPFVIVLWPLILLMCLWEIILYGRNYDR